MIFFFHPASLYHVSSPHWIQRQVIDFKITRMRIVFQKYTFRVFDRKKKQQCNVYTIPCADIEATKSDIENRRERRGKCARKNVSIRPRRITVPQKYTPYSHEKLHITHRITSSYRSFAMDRSRRDPAGECPPSRLARRRTSPVERGLSAYFHR